GESGFRGQGDVAVAGEAGTTGARGRANQAADQCAFAAAGNCADCSAAARTAADQGCSALSLTCAGLRGCGGLNVVVLILDGDGSEGQRERSGAFEATRGLGVLHDAGSTGTVGDGEPAVYLDGGLHGAGEGLAGSADLGADGLIED